MYMLLVEYARISTHVQQLNLQRTLSISIQYIALPSASQTANSVTLYVFTVHAVNASILNLSHQSK